MVKCVCPKTKADVFLQRLLSQLGGSDASLSSTPLWSDVLHPAQVQISCSTHTGEMQVQVNIPSRCRSRGGCCGRGDANPAAKRWRRGTVTARRGCSGCCCLCLSSLFAGTGKERVSAFGKGRAALWLRGLPSLVRSGPWNDGAAHTLLLLASQMFVGAPSTCDGARRVVLVPWSLVAFLQEWRLGTADRDLGGLVTTGHRSPLPFSPPAPETLDVYVLNFPLLISHGWECPNQLPLCGGEPCAGSTCTFKGQGRGCHPFVTQSAHPPSRLASATLELLPDGANQPAALQTAPLPPTATFMEMCILFKVKPGSVCTSEENLSQSMKRLSC
ncbi:uncharacterized protein LOC135295012 [Passer domesticus]|uniref:uncharacterized protein LOC135295012 n=1 Tax=Passer domesticus TaxID=48849 RepID=UPI0030FE3351